MNDKEVHIPFKEEYNPELIRKQFSPIVDLPMDEQYEIIHSTQYKQQMEKLDIANKGIRQIREFQRDTSLEKEISLSLHKLEEFDTIEENIVTSQKIQEKPIKQVQKLKEWKQTKQPAKSLNDYSFNKEQNKEFIKLYNEGLAMKQEEEAPKIKAHKKKPITKYDEDISKYDAWQCFDKKLPMPVPEQQIFVKMSAAPKYLVKVYY